METGKANKLSVISRPTEQQPTGPNISAARTTEPELALGAEPGQGRLLGWLWWGLCLLVSLVLLLALATLPHPL